MTPHWVETIVCTRPVSKPKNHRGRWRKIYDSIDDPSSDIIYVQFWISTYDLKESVVEYAKEDFGKALEQIVRLGSHPQVLYPTDAE